MGPRAMVSAVDESRDEWKARMGIGQPSNAFRIRGGPGTTQARVINDETAPRVAGAQIDHWDGRVDAIATPEPVRVKGRANL